MEITYLSGMAFANREGMPLLESINYKKSVLLRLTTVVCLILSFPFSSRSNDCSALFAPNEPFSSIMPTVRSQEYVGMTEREAIRRQALDQILSHYQMIESLHLIADTPVYSRGVAEVNNVFLSIRPNDNIQTLANVLSQGSDPGAIAKRIAEHVADGRNNISLVELLPAFARSYTHRQPKCENSNCFNAAINWHNPRIGEAYTSTDQLAQVLAKNYKKIMPGEALAFGDMIVLRNHNSFRVRMQKSSIVHTAIFIDPNLVWHKGSNSNTETWTFSRLEDVLERYDRGLQDPIEIEFFRYVPQPTLWQRIWSWHP